MSDKDTSREAFERIHLGGNKHNARRNEHADYVIPAVQDAWSGWQAALSHSAQSQEAQPVAMWNPLKDGAPVKNKWVWCLREWTPGHLGSDGIKRREVRLARRVSDEQPTYCEDTSRNTWWYDELGACWSDSTVFAWSKIIPPSANPAGVPESHSSKAGGEPVQHEKPICNCGTHTKEACELARCCNKPQPAQQAPVSAMTDEEIDKIIQLCTRHIPDDDLRELCREILSTAHSSDTPVPQQVEDKQPERVMDDVIASVRESLETAGLAPVRDAAMVSRIQAARNSVESIRAADEAAALSAQEKGGE